MEQDLLFFNGTPSPFLEDVQTCIVPDDLFREDRASQKATNLEEKIIAQTSPTVGSHIGIVRETNTVSRNKPNRRRFFNHRSKRGTQHHGNHDELVS